MGSLEEVKQLLPPARGVNLCPGRSSSTLLPRPPVLPVSHLRSRTDTSLARSGGGGLVGIGISPPPCHPSPQTQEKGWTRWCPHLARTTRVWHCTPIHPSPGALFWPASLSVLFLFGLKVAFSRFAKVTISIIWRVVSHDVLHSDSRKKSQQRLFK